MACWGRRKDKKVTGHKSDAIQVYKHNNMIWKKQESDILLHNENIIEFDDNWINDVHSQNDETEEDIPQDVETKIEEKIPGGIKLKNLSGNITININHK